MDNNHQGTMGAEQQQEQLTVLILNVESTSGTEYASGYRFCPTDEELILDYLRPKIANRLLPFNQIPTVDISKFSPETLKGGLTWSKLFKENEMFVFTPRSRKYPKGSRPDRTAANGYWKPTGTGKPVTSGCGQIIGFKRHLDFYTGNHNKGERTYWKMHEYQLELAGPAPTLNANDETAMQLDYVLCKIYLSSRKKDKDNGDGDGDEKEEKSEGDGADEEETAGSSKNGDESSPAVDKTNEAFLQNQSNNMADPNTSACSYMHEPNNNIVQMFGNNNSSIDDQTWWDSILNDDDDQVQTVPSNEPVMPNQNSNLASSNTSASDAFAWPLASNPSSSSQLFDQETAWPIFYDSPTSSQMFDQESAWPMVHNPASSSQMFEQDTSFINQSSRKRRKAEHIRDLIVMNGNNNYGGQTVQTNENSVQTWFNPAPSTFLAPVSDNPTKDQNISAILDQSTKMPNQNCSSSNHQSSWKRSCQSSMNAHNHGPQSSVQAIGGIMQTQDNNLVRMDSRTPPAFGWPNSNWEMSDQKNSFVGQSLTDRIQNFDDQKNSSMDPSLCFKDNLDQ